jgi:hypothetical protein
MRQVVFGGLSATIEHIRANKLRPLAVTTERLGPIHNQLSRNFCDREDLLEGDSQRASLIIALQHDSRCVIARRTGTM